MSAVPSIERDGTILRLHYYKRPGAPRPPKDIEREYKRSFDVLFAMCSYPDIAVLQRARLIATSRKLPFNEAVAAAFVELGFGVVHPGEYDESEFQVLDGSGTFWFEKPFIERAPEGVALH